MYSRAEFNEIIAERNEAEEKYELLFRAVKETLLSNLHLCDGDVCTLKVLRDEFIAQGGEL